MDARARLKSLLEPDRIAVAGAIVTSARTIDEICAVTGQERRRVVEAIGALRTVELIEVSESRYRLDDVALRMIAAELEESPLPMDPSIGYGMTDEERDVLARYFEGRTLTSVPVSRAKRLVVLERLALEFDVGKKYAEEEVNSILGAFDPDWSTLRRHLVDEGLLDRERNVYWRSGGRVPGVYRG